MKHWECYCGISPCTHIDHHTTVGRSRCSSCRGDWRLTCIWQYMMVHLALVFLACARCCSGVPMFGSISEAAKAYAIKR
eukprot:4554478-Pyramimonas_sp.AAC.1